MEPQERHSGSGKGNESSGPTALGLQQPSDGRWADGAGLGPGGSNLPAGRKYERLEQPAEPQPPAAVLSHGTTVNSIFTYDGAAAICTGYYCKGADHIYCTDRLLAVTLMRTSEDLRYYNQSSDIKFPSIFTEKSTYYVNQSLLPAPSLCE